MHVAAREKYRVKSLLAFPAAFISLDTEHEKFHHWEFSFD